MLHKLRERAQDEKGFTLIELLVVILIIGILAAIALPAFLNQKEKGQDAEAKSAVRTLQTAQETYYTDNQVYADTVAKLKALEPAIGDFESRVTTVTGTASGYSVEVESKGSSKVKYKITNAAGVVTRTCAPASKGGCGASGW